MALPFSEGPPQRSNRIPLEKIDCLRETEEKSTTEDAAIAGIEIGQKAKEINGGRVLDFHSFRHYYGISLRGLPKEMQMRLLRTESEQVWRRYSHPDDIQDLQENIEAINSRERIV